MEPKKARDPVFLIQLCNLVEDNWDVLECKKTDAQSVSTKNERWKLVADAFNSSSSIHYREWKKVKTLWENLKKRAKGVMANQHDNLYLTGGGKGKTLLKDPIIDRVIGLIRPQVDPLRNEYDDDHVEDVLSQSYEAEVPFHTSSSQHEDMNNTTERTTDKDWSHYNPSTLKTPRAPALRMWTEVSPNLIEQQVIVDSTPIVVESDVDLKDVTASHVKAPLMSSRNLADRKSRRRPVLKQPQTEALLSAKLSSLKSATEHADKLHSIEMETSLLQRDQEEIKLEQEKEKLLQLKIRTALLKRKLNGDEDWYSADDDKLIRKKSPRHAA